MSNFLQLRGKVLGAIVLSVLWVCGFLFISSTLYFDFGAGITLNLKFTVAILGLVILLFYHLLYPSSIEVTKLSWTAVGSIVWLSLILFFPFRDPATDKGVSGAVAFFTLVGGLAVCLFWIRFFSDEIEA